MRVATGTPAPLVEFNLAGVLAPVDVHGARTLAEIAGDDRPEVLLAAALALRAPQHGHVCVALDDVTSTITLGEDAAVDVAALDWPEPEGWRAMLADSPLVRVRPEGTPSRSELDPANDRPLVLVGHRLYLDRYWRYERRVAAVLKARAGRVDHDLDLDRVREAIDRLLPPGLERPDRQRLALATAARRSLTVIAGGPGTGKTHTVARLLALLHELAGGPGAGPGGSWPRVAVAAPTGKAADRLTASLREAVADTDLQVTDAVRARLASLEGSTLHRLLGWTPRSATRFAHSRTRRLPHDVVVVDETSMVDLPLMSKLLEALRTDARLVLVGDPDQLASVEAGAVLADIVGPSGTGLRMSEDHRAALAAATGEPLDAPTVDAEADARGDRRRGRGARRGAPVRRRVRHRPARHRDPRRRRRRGGGGAALGPRRPGLGPGARRGPRHGCAGRGPRPGRRGGARGRHRRRGTGTRTGRWPRSSRSACCAPIGAGWSG